MGFRTHEEEGALDSMSFDDYLIENKEATFMLRAGSDALKDAGILAGDMLLVDRSKDSKEGDIVIAVIDGAFVMRKMSSLLPGDARVEAVVIAVVRKY